jgi:hypothetical protein
MIYRLLFIVIFVTAVYVTESEALLLIGLVLMPTLAFLNFRAVHRQVKEQREKSRKGEDSEY